MAYPLKKNQPGNREWLWSAVLIVAVALVYAPILWAGFLWDDATVVTANPVIVGPPGLWEIWTTQAADICPLTLTAFWAEYRIWGPAPLPYHLVNILEHAASAVVLWRVLVALRIPGPWLGAAIWALHPVEVESVAWISEMKNTQSGVFYLLAIYFFVKTPASDEIQRRNFALPLLFAALAMASKSSTVILPLVLCLCAWWKEGRWQWRNLATLAPIFLMSVITAAVSIATQRVRLGAELNPSYLPPSWPERLAAAGNDIWFYLGKLVWPHPLLTFYPRWNLDLARPLAWLPLLAVAGIFVLLWFARNSWGRPFLFAFAYFVIALAPILGLVDNTIFHYAPVFDHLQYLAAMGPLALAGAGIALLSDVLPSARRWMSVALASALLILLGVTSWLQTWAYENEETLWTYTLAWNPSSAAAHYNLGNVLVHDGLPKEAIAQFRASLALDPNNAIVHNNLARVLEGIGQTSEAIDELKIAVQQNPNGSAMHDNLGIELLKAGRGQEAIQQFQEALRLDPTNAAAQANLAHAQQAAAK
jgi:tetratricopeptide (TPR) repeat protein